jgi:hypothetical protein
MEGIVSGLSFAALDAAGDVTVGTEVVPGRAGAHPYRAINATTGSAKPGSQARPTFAGRLDRVSPCRRETERPTTPEVRSRQEEKVLPFGHTFLAVREAKGDS